MPETKTLAELSGQLTALRSEVRLARRSWRFVLVLLVITIATGGALFWNDHQQDVARQRDAQQYDIDQCERGNNSRESIADIVDTQTNALIVASAPADGVVTPSRQRAVDTYRSKVDPLVKELRADRDCVALVEEGSK